MHSSYAHTRQHILDAGNPLIAAKGFTGVGLNEILQAAAVPKGSFYHYFKSKEHYGESLIAHYFETYLTGLDAAFSDERRSARERLQSYFQQWMDTQCDDCPDHKCLVVKLSAEVADLSDNLRQALRDGTDSVIDRIAGCLEAGAQDGSLPELPARHTAEILYQLWLGASLLTKLHRSRTPLEHAMAFTRQTLSGRPSATP